MFQLLSYIFKLCKNHCGFYGTPQWNGLCSHCWRVTQHEKKKIKDFQKNKYFSNFYIFKTIILGHY